MQNAALQLSLEHQQMNQHIQQQEANMAQQAHSRINQITTEAQAEILKHQQIAEQAQREIQRVTAAAEARCQDLARENEALRASLVAGYFDACPSEAGRAPSVASASPLNVVYCHAVVTKMLLGVVGVGTAKIVLKSPRMVRTLLNHLLMKDICTQCLRDPLVLRPSGSQSTFKGTLRRMKDHPMQKFLFLEPLAVRDRMACRVVRCMMVLMFIILVLIPGWSMECRPQRLFQSQGVLLFLV